MDAMTRVNTVNRTTTLLKECGAVASINQWTGESITRYYLNLRHANRSFRGDNTSKIYVDDRGVLIYHPGKGTQSDGFCADRDEILDFAKRNEIALEKI